VPLLAAGALCTVAALLGMTTDTFWWLLCVRCLFGIGMGINKCVPWPVPACCGRERARCGARTMRGGGASRGADCAPSPFARLALCLPFRSASLAIYYAEITPKAERGVRHTHTRARNCAMHTHTRMHASLSPNTHETRARAPSFLCFCRALLR
jgi:hypothetical protein